MRVLRVFVLVALVLTITATPAAAADIRQGNDVIIGPTETVEDDLYAFAATIAINGTVHGDVVAAGNNVSVDGSEVARLAAAFGMRVIGVDERRRDAPPGVAELHRGDELDALLPQADFVILTVPHTPETEGFMNRARFQEMKKTAFFINIGRGMTTRLDDLVEALRVGEIAGAGLDVFEQEPLPADHPLWSTPGVLITPHTAGFGPYLDERRFEILLDNCRRFTAGQPLRNVVDKPAWF